MNFWTCIYLPFVLLISLAAAALFVLCIYVKLAVCGVLWILRRFKR